MLAEAVIWFCRIGRPDWIIPRWSQSQHRQQGDKMLCRGIIRSFNGRFGYIHYQRNTKNLRFEANDLRGIGSYAMRRGPSATGDARWSLLPCGTQGSAGGIGAGSGGIGAGSGGIGAFLFLAGIFFLAGIAAR